jgi:hypothetical protein
VALSGKNSKIKWTHQTVANDTGIFEADIGDSPQIYRLSSGEKVVGAEEKNGIYWVLDATSGELVGLRCSVVFWVQRAFSLTAR